MLCCPLKFGTGVGTTISLQLISVCMTEEFLFDPYIFSPNFYKSYQLVKYHQMDLIQQAHLAQHTAVLDVR